MRPSSDLFDLIKKLSKSEKRYFMLNCQLQQGQKTYLHIYKEIEKMTDYDEGLLIKRLKKKNIHIVQMHVAKNHLSWQILKALRAFHEKNSTRQKLFALMSDADLLESKGLYKQCMKKLRSAKKLANKHEMHRYRSDIIQKEINLEMSSKERGLEQLVEEGYSELERASAFSHKEDGLFKIMHKLFALYQTSGKAGHKKISTYINSLEDHSLLQGISDRNDSFESKLNYFYIHAFCHHLKGEYKKANPYYKKVLEIWDKHPHIRSERSSSYKKHLANFLNSCHTIQDYRLFPKLLERFKSIEDKSFSEEASSFQGYYFLYLLFYLNSGQFQKALELVPDIEKGFEKYRSRILKNREMAINFNVFFLFFALENFDKALEWLNKIPQSKKIESRTDTQLFARVMKLIVHFELGNLWILEDMHSSVYRGLKKIEQLHEFERAVLDHIRDLQKAGSKKEVREQHLAFVKTWGAIKEKPGSEKIIGFIEVGVWATCRAKGIRYVDELKEQLEKQSGA